MTRSWWPRSLQGRLLLAVLAVMAASWVMAAVATWVDARHELDELLDGHLAQAAALLVVQQSGESEEMGADERDDVRLGQDAPSLHRYAPKVAFQVWHEGQLVLRSDSAPTYPMGPDGRHFASGFATLEVQGERWRVYTTQGHEQDVQVYVGERVDSRVGIGRAVLRSSLMPFALMLPLGLLALWWVVRRALSPLRDLSQVLAERSPDALAPVQLTQHAPSEMTPVVSALNELFGRIQHLMASERRFTADAAHELRTPIAAIRTQAQVALAAPDDGGRQHALQATLEGCDRATHLVAQLLTLSRLEARGEPPSGSVNLAALCQRVLAQAVHAALDKQQTLSLQVGEGGAEASPSAARWTVTGQEALLEVLLRNLVDNAIRYAPPGAQVQVHLQGRAGVLQLSVEDSGPGMTEADMARLGERFFRVLGTEQSGSGLGWSIVRRIADLHGVRLAVSRSEALGGLLVWLGWSP